MNTTNINVTLRRDIATNKITIGNTIQVIKAIRDFTYCDLKVAKNIVDTFAHSINKADINNPVLRADIRSAINDLEGNDLIDIMRFIQAIKDTSVNTKTPNPNLEDFLD